MQLIALVNASRSSVVRGPWSVVAEGSAETAFSTLPTAYCILPTAKPIGLSGPMSNYAAPPQLVENVPYRDLHEMHAFARKWRDEHRGKWFTAHKLSGFCLLMKRAVYEKIGGMNERFGLGFFDDDDLAERARRAGFEMAVAHDLFVHHFGSRTFQGNGIDAKKQLDENARRFAEKWGLKETNGTPVTLQPWQPSFLSESQRAFARRVEGPGGGASTSHESVAQQRPATNFPLARGADEGSVRLGAPHADASVSLTMIVKNEEDHLAKCLESVRPLFDEIIVVDTGSTDRTREIASHSGRGCLTSPGSTTSPRRATRPCRTRPAITRFGSTPMTWSIHRSAKN